MDPSFPLSIRQLSSLRMEIMYTCLTKREILSIVRNITALVPKAGRKQHMLALVKDGEDCMLKWNGLILKEQSIKECLSEETFASRITDNTVRSYFK